jgi:hypothetical protein
VQEGEKKGGLDAASLVRQLKEIQAGSLVADYNKKG